MRASLQVAITLGMTPSRLLPEGGPANRTIEHNEQTRDEGNMPMSEPLVEYLMSYWPSCVTVNFADPDPPAIGEACCRVVEGGDRATTRQAQKTKTTLPECCEFL